MILSIDQSTSGTKALIFQESGKLVAREDVPHRQITNDQGWVEHDLKEIYQNVLQSVSLVLKNHNISPEKIEAVGISNQRETAAAWDRRTGEPICNAIVWQCGRAAKLCEEIQQYASVVREKTGLNLSPFFSAAKWKWMVRNLPEIKVLQENKNLCLGTIDSYLIYRLTNQKSFYTDYSNASRTELLNLDSLGWDEELLDIFELKKSSLPEIVGSDELFGYTDFGGVLPKQVPIHGVLGDSHAALFGNACLTAGMAKATYGTGSSVMMNVGKERQNPSTGIVASLAWGRNGTVDYVLEGNINYTGAVTKWLTEDVGLLQHARDAGKIAQTVQDTGGVYLVPAFTGLGAPYWDSNARAIWCGMNRTTKAAHLIRAAEECIAYQICDIVAEMNQSASKPLSSIRVDGGPTHDQFLMQFQADMLGIPVQLSEIEELSGAGAAFMAAIAAGISSEEEIFSSKKKLEYLPKMPHEQRGIRYQGWKNAVNMILS